MRTGISRLSICIAFLIFVCGCQKDDVTATDYITETTTHSDDEARFSNESDAVANDVDAALDITPGFAGRSGNTQNLICDAVITVDTLSNPRTITITYNGSNCLGNRTRTGSVVISMPAGTRWRNPGAAVTVAFNNLKVTRLSDNKSITINGSQVHTNVGGGLLFSLSAQGSITHTITSNNMSVTFDNNSQRTWQVAKQRVFSYNNGIVITTTGTHSQNGRTGIAEWGTNRFGNSFTTVIAQPLVIRQDCSFRLVSGKVTHETSLFSASVIFGLDSAGNPTTCPATGTFYFKLSWMGPSGLTRTAILPY